MATTVYITDPVVAVAYHTTPAQFVSIADPAEAAWLIEQHHAYPITGPALPGAYYVHPDAPNPFVDYATATAPAPAPSPEPAPPPPPAPAPQSLAIGAEDQYIPIDVNADGKTDVHVLVDKPPQNP